MEKEREREGKSTSRLKSSLGCKEGAWDTIQEAKQLHLAVSLKSLSARERVQE